MIYSTKILLIVFIVSITLLASDVKALGLSMGPANIYITGATRGQEYERQLFISNPDTYEKELLLSIEGDCADWASFYLTETDEQIANVLIPPKDNVKVLVRFGIPNDIPTGNYSCVIFAETTPEENVEGSSTGIRVRSNVKIEVTGEQILSGNVRGIEINDIEINQILRIKVYFENTGNVIAAPQVEATLLKNDAQITSIFYNQSVKTQRIETIEAEWDTIGQTIGNYTANVKVYLDNNLLEEKNLNFKILERGTLTAEGKISNVNAPQETNLGQVAKIEVQFQNIGQIDVTAKITGEVYSGDRLIDTITGDDTLVKIGETKTLTSYFKPEDSGEYTIKANVVYEGKTLEMDPISISVKSSNPLTGFSILPILTNPILWIVLGTIIVVAIAVLIKKRRYYSSFSHKKFRYISLAYSWLKYAYKPFYNLLSRFAFLMF